MENNLQAFTQHDVEVLKREILYQGIFRLVRYHLRHKYFNGEWSNVFTREIFERKPAAAVLLYDPVLDYVVLIQQFRAGVLSTKVKDESPWILEVVAGIFDQDESAKDLISRETQEEAGCKVLDIYPICTYFVSPGGSNEHMQLFCGRVDATDAGGIHGLLHENENIRALSMPTEEAWKLLQEGKIQTSPAIIALQWLQLNKEWLRQLWQTK